MEQFCEDIIINTEKNRELINITPNLENFVSKSGIKEGLYVIFSLHATGAIIINEDESCLKEDFLDNIERIIPQKGSYKHNIYDNNASSHIAASLFSPEQTLIISDNKIQIGNWQSILFLELDGPRRERKVKVKIIGE